MQHWQICHNCHSWRRLRYVCRQRQQWRRRYLTWCKQGLFVCQRFVGTSSYEVVVVDVADADAATAVIVVQCFCLFSLWISLSRLRNTCFSLHSIQRRHKQKQRLQICTHDYNNKDRNERDRVWLLGGNTGDSNANSKIHSTELILNTTTTTSIGRTIFYPYSIYVAGK